MLEVTPIPAFSDNYIWCLTRSGEREAVVVDPGDGNAVLSALEEREYALAGILVTHHHFDHTGGLERLLEHRSVPVYGPVNPAISHISERLREGDSAVVLGVSWKVIEVPGHTLDHIAFYGEPEDSDPLLFCGDTLFAGGCGRVFEGNPGMMLESLHKLAALPPQTRVFCAHEYTMANLAFAAAVDPSNDALQSRIGRDQAARDLGRPTVPSTIGLELETNPFLRCTDERIAAHMRDRDQVDPDDPVAVFAAVRGWKDNF
jgi:hydroxyacylglutathione hydrolase